MPVTEVPRFWVIVCDGCGVKVEAKSADRPSRWAKLTFAQDAEDYQGMPCADATIHALFCPACRNKIAQAINAAVVTIKQGGAE